MPASRLSHLNMHTTDTELITARYEQMTADQLLLFVQEEGYRLSEDLFLLLKTICEKRNLHCERLQQIEQDRAEAAALQIDPALMLEKDHSAEAFWQVLFVMKVRRYPEEKINAFLTRKGFSDEEVSRLLNELHPQSAAQVRRHRQRNTLGILLLLTGLIAISLTISAPDVHPLYHIGWVFLIISIPMLFRGRKEYQLAEKVMYMTEKEGYDRAAQEETIPF